jgi:hypothetical protein
MELVGTPADACVRSLCPRYALRNKKIVIPGRASKSAIADLDARTRKSRDFDNFWIPGSRRWARIRAIRWRTPE